MRKIEKLLRKLRKKDRQKLLSIVRKLTTGQIVKIEVKKIKNTDLYRLRHKNFRIVFHYENKEVIIDIVKLKNKNTYKNL